MGKPRGNKNRECVKFADGSFLARRILSERKEGDKIFYRIQWNSGEITEEPEEHMLANTELIETYKKIKEFNEDIKKHTRDNFKPLSNEQASIYSRVSKSNDMSLGTQTDYSKNYCKNKGITISDMTKDNGVSGRHMKNFTHGNLGKLFTYLTEDDSHSCIIIYNIDRLCRDVQGGLNFLQKCEENNIDVHFVMEDVVWNKDTSSFNKKNIRDGLITAQHYSDRLSETLQNSNTRLRAKGTVFGRAPYGKKAGKNNNGIRKFSNHIGEMNAKNKIMKNYKKFHIIHKLSKSKSYTKIIRELKRNSNTRTKRGKEWTKNMIGNIIKQTLKEERDLSDLNLNKLDL
jgi:DNA invertase Pin-like site-specific DNA recombinase